MELNFLHLGFFFIVFAKPPKKCDSIGRGFKNSPKYLFSSRQLKRLLSTSTLISSINIEGNLPLLMVSILNPATLRKTRQKTPRVSRNTAPRSLSVLVNHELTQLLFFIEPVPNSLPDAFGPESDPSGIDNIPSRLEEISNQSTATTTFARNRIS